MAYKIRMKYVVHPGWSDEVWDSFKHLFPNSNGNYHDYRENKDA